MSEMDWRNLLRMTVRGQLFDGDHVRVPCPAADRGEEISARDLREFGKIVRDVACQEAADAYLETGNNAHLDAVRKVDGVLKECGVATIEVMHFGRGVFVLV